MIYLIVFAFLFAAELFYIRLADRFNIIDKPNERSSHKTVTIRGGGVIFYLGAMVYFVVAGFPYPWFFLGLTLMTVVSFLDDVMTLSNRVRLLVHFTSVLLLSQELGVLHMPWYWVLITFIVVVGVINAYNFMDGINGITAAYSLSVGGLLFMVNRQVPFMDSDFLIFTLVSVLVFAWFNFRGKAKWNCNLK